jgi:hypothetical protein
MPTLQDIASEVQHFEQLDSDGRKASIRALERRVRIGEVALSDGEFDHALASQDALSRIVAYLAVQYARVPITPGVLRTMITSEIELLRRKEFVEEYSRMPLYYATRAYLERIKTDKPLATAAAADIPMLKRIESELLIRDVDRNGQVLPTIQEAIECLGNARNKDVNATIASARLALIGVIVAAVIAAASAVASAVITARGQAHERKAEAERAALKSLPIPPANETKESALPANNLP